LKLLAALAALGAGFQLAGRDPVFSPTLLTAHLIGFFPVAMIARGRQRFMAFAALGRHTDSLGRNPVGRTATGASNDNLVGVVHWSPHLIFLYNNASNLVVKDIRPTS
jgi:hypothetical protein